MRILFIAPRFPYPPMRGYQVRAFHQLRLLSAHHRITLVTFSDRETPPEGHAKIASFCEEVITVPHRMTGMFAGLSAGLMSRRPLQTALFTTPEMSRVIDRLRREKRHELVHVQLARMAAYLERTSSLPRVIDLVDALSLNFARRGKYDRLPLNLVSRLEARRLSRCEREICTSWDHATVVSARDREAIGNFPKLTVNSSGVDLDEYQFRSGDRDPYTILFTGKLDYFSNINAIRWFASEVFPLIRRAEPKANLVIVGARPARSVRALAANDARISVAGFVERPQDYLQRCGIAIAPMRTGSGQLFKVLEAMASGAPLIATSIGIAGSQRSPSAISWSRIRRRFSRNRHSV